MIKRHVNPNARRTSKAPYNFVPQPEKVFYAEKGYQNARPWEANDRFMDATFTGEIDIEAITLSPLFIRGPQHKTGSGWDNKDSRLREESFTDAHGKPIIPGSSMRGMIRNILEIITFSKLAPVSPDKLFYRSMAADNIGQTYRNYLMRGGRKPAGGFFKRDGLGGFIEPCEVFKVPHSKINGLNYRMHPGYVPERSLQGKQVTVQIKEATISGKLVITGCAPKKKHEFIFVEQGTAENKIAIPEAMLERFEDDDQVTQWQEKVFPKNSSETNCRRKSGALADNEPVFYICDESFVSHENPDGLMFFGRAQMFRLPYDLSPEDMTDNLNEMDMAEAIFGKVDRNNANGKAIKGRVSFSNLRIVSENCENAIEREAIVPKLLSSPRPTTFQHYLVQSFPDSEAELRTYLKNNPTTLRGHKLYWHRWSETGRLSDVKDPDNNKLLRDLRSNSPSDKMHTLIKPVKENTEFSGKIRFYNLKKSELGALLSSIQLPEECAHKLGMAKPHGLGSLKVKVKSVNAIAPQDRYSDWQNDGIKGLAPNEFIESFTKLILSFAKRENEPMWPDRDGLASIFRVDALYKMLNWQNRPPRVDTEYQKLEEFKGRKVLPTPHAVLNITKQPFEDRPERLVKVKDLTVGNKPRISTIPPPPPVVARQQTLAIGQEFEGILINTENGLAAKFEADERDARILNLSKIPDNVVEGTKAVFIVRTMRRSDGLSVEFRQMLD